MALRHILILVILPLSTGPLEAEAGSLCNQIGRELEGARVLTLAQVGTGTRQASGAVRLKGRFVHEFERIQLCPVDEVGQAPCLQLALSRLRNSTDINHVLEQWNGETVLADGLLERRVALGRVLWPALEVVGLKIESQPARESYCADYLGPLVPSAAERRATETGERSLHGRGRVSRLNDATLVWLHRHQAIAWIQKPDTEPIPMEFEVPFPFHGRDIREFAALTDAVFLFTLGNGHLYLSDSDGATELERSAVDQLSRGTSGVFYRRRELGPNGSFLANSVRRIGSKGETESVWRSSDRELLFFLLERGDDEKEPASLEVVLRAPSPCEREFVYLGKPTRRECLPDPRDSGE